MSQTRLIVLVLLIATLASFITSLPIDDSSENQISSGYANEQRDSSYQDAQVKVIQHLASMLNESPHQLIKDLAFLKLAKQLHLKEADMNAGMHASKRGHIWKRSVSMELSQ